MSRKSTISPEWKDLIDKVGGIGEICAALGMGPKQFYLNSRGKVRFPETKRLALEILCEIEDVKNPLDAGPIARAKDLSPLRMLGDSLARGFPPAPRTLEKLRSIYPQVQLLELAESDGTPEAILRGVTCLLELT